MEGIKRSYSWGIQQGIEALCPYCSKRSLRLYPLNEKIPLSYTIQCGHCKKDFQLCMGSRHNRFKRKKVKPLTREELIDMD